MICDGYHAIRERSLTRRVVLLARVALSPTARLTANAQSLFLPGGRSCATETKEAENPCILVVENDPDTRDVLKEILAEDSHTVRIAGDGAAVQDLTSEEDVPTVVLVDNWVRSSPAEIPSSSTSARRSSPEEAVQPR